MNMTFFKATRATATPIFFLLCWNWKSLFYSLYWH